MNEFVDVTADAKPYGLTDKVEISSNVFNECVRYSHREDGGTCSSCERVRLQKLLNSTAATYRALRATRQPGMVFRHVYDKSDSQLKTELELELKVWTFGNPLRSAVTIQFPMVKSSSLAELI